MSLNDFLDTHIKKTGDKNNRGVGNFSPEKSRNCVHGTVNHKKTYEPKRSTGSQEKKRQADP